MLAAALRGVHTMPGTRSLLAPRGPTFVMDEDDVAAYVRALPYIAGISKTTYALATPRSLD